MGYWKSASPLIWQDTALDIFGTERFRVIDGGAAGGLFEPFDAVAESCVVHTFEPRGEDTIEYEGRRNIDAGLWDKRCKQTLHIAHEPTTSSIYPPDLAYLARFPDRVGSPARRAVEKIEIDMTSIDAEVAAGTIKQPNFIKLDIHSAEYEALLGSKNSLGECLGLLVETWHAPIHADQHLNGEIEALIDQYGFRLYDTRQASRWSHAVEGKIEKTDRRQLVGSESLFLREDVPVHLRTWNVALLELFGYSNLAVSACDRMLAENGIAVSDSDCLAMIRAKLIVNQGIRSSLVSQARGTPVHHGADRTKRPHHTKKIGMRSWFGLRP